MKNFLFNLLCVFLVTITRLSAYEECCSDRYWYTSMGGGATFRDKEFLGNGTKTFQAGPMLDTALGYQFSPHFRMEGAFAFRTHPLDSVTDTIQTDPLTAEESSYTLLLNTVMMGDYFWRFKPYAGWGIGFGDVLYSIHTSQQPPPSATHTQHHSRGFGYQLIGGISYFLGCHLDLEFEYRFVGITGLEYRFLDSRFQTNDVLVKLVYAFRNRENPFSYCCPAFCDPADCFYLTTKIGANFRETNSYANGKKTFHAGPCFAAAIGYYPRVSWLRGELEFAFRQNEVNKLIVSDFRPTGDEIVLTTLFNGYIEPFSFCGLTPYAGAGLGYAYTSYSAHINLPPNSSTAPPIAPTFKHSRLNSNNFAYQAMGGIHYPISDHTLLGIEYQYLCVKNQEYQSFGLKSSVDAISHSATLRLTYLIGP
ncbi:MAG: outer membrane beta-barrel protein [Chlamydiia bacterium]|nr:outer membrane beta-barrel protein [Chlamydiia bacterium]